MYSFSDNNPFFRILFGLNSEITTFESKVYWDEFPKGTFDVGRDGWTGDYPDPLTNMFLWKLSRASKDTRWFNSQAEEYDRLIRENEAITDPQKRLDNFEKAEKILMDEMPIIPLYYMDDTILIKPEVKGVVKSYIGHTLFEYADIVQ